ncbi:MAG: hypothetical protein IT229_01050 [Flavobacteriales bacterium]|nr:hypothetical protein [Flavobacteriales bacterium]
MDTLLWSDLEVTNCDLKIYFGVMSKVLIKIVLGARVPAQHVIPRNNLSHP